MIHDLLCYVKTSELKRLQEFMKKAFLGISPFNPYYTKNTIRKYESWALENEFELYYLIGDSIYVNTLIVLNGLDADEAKRKMEEIGLELRKRITRAIKVSFNSHKILNWNMILSNEYYKNFLLRLYDLYNNSDEFRKLCHSQIKYNLGERIDKASNRYLVNYLLNEIAGLSAMSEYFNIHLEIYPGEDLIILEKLFNGFWKEEFGNLINKKKRSFINMRFE